MTQPNLEQLLEAGVHFGHQTRRWNPKMRRFIFAERNGIHIIDLQKTLRQLELAQKLVREVVLRGENVLFVCTKRQLDRASCRPKPSAAARCTSPSAGSAALLTNFQTVKKQVRRLKDLEAGSEEGGDFENYTKKEQLMMSRRARQAEQVPLGHQEHDAVCRACMFVDRLEEGEDRRHRGEQAPASRSSRSSTRTRIPISSPCRSPATTMRSARWS